MTILSFDASLTSSGWAVCDDTYKLIAVGKVRTEKTTPKRLLYIFDEFEKLFIKYKPNIVKMENGFCGNNPKTSFNLVTVRSFVIVLADRYNCKFYQFEPTAIKKEVTGKGNATKEEVYIKLCELYKDDKIFNNIGPFRSTQTKKLEKTEDIYDAISIARVNIE